MQAPIWALAVAVIGGGILQLAMQLMALKRLGLLPRFCSPFQSLKDSAVRQTLHLMVPAVVGVSVAPISILINTNIASRLNHGAVTWLNYADRLMEFPTALLGVALGTVLLPSLASAFNRGELDRYNRLLDRGLRLVVLLPCRLPSGSGSWPSASLRSFFRGKLYGRRRHADGGCH